MLEYIAEIDIACLIYGDIFYVRAGNKKDALEKVYKFCKDKEYEYYKKDIQIHLITELYKRDSGDVIELR